MPATPGEQQLIQMLQTLAGGQAPGSFGPGQALALLVGFVKLRDRVDQAVITNAQLDARLVALETWKTTVDAQIADLEARVAQLEAPPPPP